MNASKLKTFLMYATIGAGLAAGLLLWSTRQQKDLLPLAQPHPRPAITSEPRGRLQPSTEEAKAELSRIVQAQLDAIQAGDYAKAYGLADRGIQAAFTLKDFEQMVKRDYPGIAEWKTVRFGPSLDNGSTGQLKVFVLGDEKQETEFLYKLGKEDGTWKVAGVNGPPPKSATPGGQL